MSQPVFWGRACQPVRVSWDAPRVDWANWQLSLHCEGCGRMRQLEVLASVAEDVQMAEHVEKIQLSALHAPPEVVL